MFNNFKYAYLIGNFFFLLVWIILFLYRRDLRKEMLTMSLLVAPLGFTQVFYFQDYWRPDYFWKPIINMVGIEDILFSFFIGGIAAVIYEEFFGKKYTKRHLQSRIWWMFGFVVLSIVFMAIGRLIFKINFMYLSILFSLFIGVLIIILRHDLLMDALFSGLLIGGLMFIFYLVFGQLFDGIIQKWWMLKNISGILIFGVPLEELMWGFSWGFVAGPTYEFIKGLRFKKF